MNAKGKQISALPIIAALLVLLCAVFHTSAMAANLPETSSLTARCLYAGDALDGVTFDLYRVASREGYSAFTPVAPFASYPIALDCSDQAQWDALALTLKGYIQLDGLTPLSSGSTDTHGEILFQNLPSGLYLVVGSSCEKDGYRYEAAPFFAALPAVDPVSGAWITDALALPKISRSAIPPHGETVTRKVLKIWNDAGLEAARPEQVTVQLLCDGTVYDTVVLRASDSWRHTWEDLPAESEWTLVEQPVAGYTALTAQEGVTFTVTNTPVTPPSPPSPPDVPDTPITPGTPDVPSVPDVPILPDLPGTPGEELPILPQTGQLWWPVLPLTAAGLLLIILGLVRRKGERS